MSEQTPSTSKSVTKKPKIGAAMLAGSIAAGGLIASAPPASAAVNLSYWVTACASIGGDYGNGGDAGHYCVLEEYGIVLWY